MLMTSWVGSFDTEINNCSANLNCFVEAGQKGGSLLNEHKGSKLRLVILKHELSIFKFNLCMASTH